MWKKFVLKESYRELFWISLSFCFLQLTLLTIALTSVVRYDLWVIALLGGAVVWRLPGKRGLLITLSLLFGCALVRHLILTEHLWNLAIESSLALSLIALFFAFDNGQTWLSALEKQKDNLLQKNGLLEEELKKSEEFYQKNTVSLKDGLKNKENKVSELQENSRKRERELLTKLLKYENENNVFRQKFESLKQEEEAFCKSLQSGDFKEIASHPLKEALERFLGQNQPHGEWEHLYKQLRVQFDAKNAELHKAREELFLTSETILALKKEKEEELLMGTNIAEDAKEFIALDEQCKKQEEENYLLKELVATLNEQLKQEKPKKKKRKEEEILPLFENNSI